MSYIDAPATELVATSCACCARPLLDADSLKLGVGPVCAKRHGFTKPVLFPEWDAVKKALGDEEYAALQIDKMRSLYKDHEVARFAANRLVYRVAAEQTGPRVAARTVALAALGYGELAAKIAERLGAVRVVAEGDTLVVEAPKSDAFTAYCRHNVPGSRWVRERKVRTVPASSRKQLWAALKYAFAGNLVIGSRWAVA